MEVTGLLYLQYRKENGGKCWVLECDCQAGPPHHLKAVGAGRDRKKPLMEHYTLAPDLCPAHHSEYHNIGERKFIEKHGDIWKYALLELAKYLFMKETDHEWEISKAIKKTGKEGLF